MNSVSIYFVTDNQAGENVILKLKTLDLQIKKLSFEEICMIKPVENLISIIFVDVNKLPLSEIISIFDQYPQLHNLLKFVILDSSMIAHAAKISGNVMHLEFIEKPYNIHEFILLLEKSIVVEKYRVIMKNLSSEYEKRIEDFESFFHINKRDIFDANDSVQTFNKILDFEKNLLQKQSELNAKLTEFTSFRQKDLLETKNLLFANKMLDQLREKELFDANELIDAQKKVLEYSHHQLNDQIMLVKAQEKVVELSRDEAISLHSTIEKLIKENEYLLEENQKMKAEQIEEQK